MTTPNEPEMIEIESVDHFATLLQGWMLHTSRILAHMKEIPEGTEVSLSGDDEDTQLTLSGDSLHAFKLGITFAQEQLDNNPFVLSSTEASEESSQAN